MGGGIGYEELREAARRAALDLSATLGGGGVAARFVLDYARRNRRVALTAHLPRYRELVAVIHRECLLAMVARIELELPRELRPAKKRPQSNAGEEDPLARRFRILFYENLAAVFDWRREDLDRFWRELDLYLQLLRAKRGERGRRKKADLGPFADRCGFMLDPAMLERSRRAAARFHQQLDVAARKILRSSLRCAP